MYHLQGQARIDRCHHRIHALPWCQCSAGNAYFCASCTLSCMLQLDQYTSPTTGNFFFRAEFDLASLESHPLNLEKAFAELAPQFGMEHKFTYPSRPPKASLGHNWHHPGAHMTSVDISVDVLAVHVQVAILCSKTDHCLRELLWKKANGDLPMRVPLVVSNHDSLRGYAEEAGAAFHRISVTKDNKLEAEAALLKLLRDNRIDLVVLARYMQILSADFTEAFGSSRIINIHHSFLPAFVGANPYGQAHKRGVKVPRCARLTSFHASPSPVPCSSLVPLRISSPPISTKAPASPRAPALSYVPAGPIIGQDVAHISHSETGKQLVAIGKEVERKVLSKAVKQWCEDRLFIDGDNRTVVFT